MPEASMVAMGRGVAASRRFAGALVTTASLGLLLAACEFPAETAPRPEDTPSPVASPLQARDAEAAELYRVVETYFNEWLSLHPIQASELGDRRFDDRFGDYASASWMADSLGIEQEALERLATVDAKRLQGEDRLSYDAFKRQREIEIYGYRYPSELLAIDQCTEWTTALAQLASDTDGNAFRTARDYDELLARMDGFAAWSGQVVNNLRAGVSKGVVLPKAVVQRTLPRLQAFADIDDPRKSIFWRPLLNFPAGLSIDDRRRLLVAFDDKLRNKVIPEYRRLHDYLAQEYLPQARDTVAWSQLPGGDYWYAWLVRRHTSTELTPDQVHELGLREVARLHAAIAALQPALEIPGDTRTALETLRSDAAARAASAAELQSAFRALRGRVDENLPSSFPRMPSTPLEIRAGESFRADCGEATHYRSSSADGQRPAVLVIDTAHGATLPTYEIDTVFLQQALPGRHLQRSVARERPNLPGFRRYDAWNSGYADGWALYASLLGSQVGLYAEPKMQLGALTSELKRAAALVVDTGIHAKGWSRPRAIEYLRANSTLDTAEIEAEVDRYIARPGEALAYKVGQIKLLELRRQAERRLGPAFDLREFHDQVLGSGALPFRVLEGKLRRWTARDS
jgi:uncharacterized protein (DUF885 family)